MSGTTIDAVAKFLLSGPDLGQKYHWIERAILFAQLLFHSRGDLRMRQRSLIGRRRSMIAFDHFRSLAALLLQLERRLEEVDVEPCGRVEAGQGKNTVECMQAGAVFGFAGLVDGLVGRIREDVDGFAGDDVAIIATGHTAPLLLPELQTVSQYDQHLTLHGLRLIFERNRDAQRGRLKTAR
jgi:hypothetical protein